MFSKDLKAVLDLKSWEEMETHLGEKDTLRFSHSFENRCDIHQGILHPQCLALCSICAEEELPACWKFGPQPSLFPFLNSQLLSGPRFLC